MTQSSASNDSPDAFAKLGLTDKVLQAVDALGYAEPTPVQAAAIPLALEGRDLLAAAQTGTGKTAAFLLPTMSRLGHASRGHGPLMLIVTPTRELAQQITDVCDVIQKSTRHKCLTVVGGVGYEPQKEALRRGCDVLVATPGRLVDLIEQGEARLGEVQTLVLDEADRMLDMGFLPQMRKIVGQTPTTRQTLLFSATLDEEAIGGIKDLVSDPATVEIAHKGTVADTIDQYVLPVSLEAKNALLAVVLKSEGTRRVIVFTRTKHRADACCRRLRRAGVTCAPIHGNRNQNQRERALKEFRDGRVDVLVATDVLARGIDVSEVRYVVNFDVPGDPEDYIHRIGRTGRAGETGWALTFVTENDAEDLVAIEKLMGKEVPTYEPKKKLELGVEPPDLDGARAAAAGNARKKGKKIAKTVKESEKSANEPQVKTPKAQAPAKNAAKRSAEEKGADNKSTDEAAPKPKRRRRRSRGKKSESQEIAPATKKGSSPSESGKKTNPRRKVGDQRGRRQGVH